MFTSLYSVVSCCLLLSSGVEIQHRDDRQRSRKQIKTHKRLKYEPLLFGQDIAENVHPGVFGPNFLKSVHVLTSCVFSFVQRYSFVFLVCVYKQGHNICSDSLTVSISFDHKQIACECVWSDLSVNNVCHPFNPYCGLFLLHNVSVWCMDTCMSVIKRDWCKEATALVKGLIANGKSTLEGHIIIAYVSRRHTF